MCPGPALALAVARGTATDKATGTGRVTAMGAAPERAKGRLGSRSRTRSHQAGAGGNLATTEGRVHPRGSRVSKGGRALDLAPRHRSSRASTEGSPAPALAARRRDSRVSTEGSPAPALAADRSRIRKAATAHHRLAGEATRRRDPCRRPCRHPCLGGPTTIPCRRPDTPGQDGEACAGEAWCSLTQARSRRLAGPTRASSRSTRRHHS